MADYLVLTRYEGIYDGQEWRMKAGEVISDAQVPVVALAAYGLQAVPYVAATMAAAVVAFNERYGDDEWPEGMAEAFMSAGLSGGVPVLTGAVAPGGVVTGLLGQWYRDTALGTWWQCTSNPSGTAWNSYRTTAQLSSIVGGSEGAALIGTDAKANLGGATTVEAALTSIDTANSATAAELASTTGGSEGALLVGTDAKANLGASTTVEAALTSLNAKNPPARSSGAVNPNDGAGTAGAIGDIYLNTATNQLWVNQDGTVAGWVLTDNDLGSVAVLELEQSGVPVAGQLLTIGADIYEADGAGANINFVIAAAEVTMNNLLAAAVANGTEDFFWDKIDATHLRIRSADAPQGNVIPADPNIAVANTLANYLLSTGAPGNVNTEAGRAASVKTESMAVLALTAAHAAIGQVRFAFPFTVTAFMVQCRAAGVIFNPAADTFTIDNGDVLVTLAGGAGNLAATNVVTVIAWA